jgi:hypothetical protein
MDAITFTDGLRGTTVKIGRRMAGTIKTVEGGFQYWPKGSRNAGDIFPTMAECRRSLA